MADKSHIEWTDSTWNPATGCTKVSWGCKHCYAEREWARLSAPREPPNIYTGRDFTDIATHPQKLLDPLRWTKPRRIFVNSMSDLFHEGIAEDFVDDVFAVMELAHWHQFQILTKRPERMWRYVLTGERTLKFHAAVERIASHGHIRTRGPDQGPRGNGSWTFPPANVWLGVSVEDQETANDRIRYLMDTPGVAVRFISCEPLLGPLRLGPFLKGWENPADVDMAARWLPGIDWVIAGGESGPRARPTAGDWIRNIRDECAAARVPFFFKQWGEWAPADVAQFRNPSGQHCHDATGVLMARAGKKINGARLDGREHRDWPA